MLKWIFKVETTVGRNNPAMRVLSEINKPVVSWQENTKKIQFTSQDCGLLLLDYFSKTESDTIVDEFGNIVKDTMWRISKIWCDDILLEQWFINHAVYYPKYFPNFLKKFPDSPVKIQSPYQFNFPGLIKWQWEQGQEFWDWYFTEKNNREEINGLEQDPDRVWKFRGSLDPCDDLVKGIKDLLEL